jgi:hypothetical protein
MPTDNIQPRFETGLSNLIVKYEAVDLLREDIVTHNLSVQYFFWHYPFHAN